MGPVTQAPGVFKNDPGQPTRDDSLAGGGNQWSPPLTDQQKPYFEFGLGFSTPGPLFIDDRPPCDRSPFHSPRPFDS